MPLTANLAAHGALDATEPELGCFLPWESIYRTRPRPALTCRDCEGPMHAKISSRGLRFFAHDRRSPYCASAGETEEHRILKRDLAQAAREAGCRAELEVTAAHGGWRADVLVTAPHGRRTALEAQVSSASVDDILDRTRRYQDGDNVDVLWFTHRSARWLDHVPSAHLYRPARPQDPWVRTHERVSRFSVVSCAEICDPRPAWHNDYHTSWIASAELSLGEFVAGVLHGRLVPRTQPGVGGLLFQGWTTPRDVQAEAKYQAEVAKPKPSPPPPPPW
ncbi:competence protein CoiA [Streptomyces sp. NPDC020883]|uniref:competence protein CoiA n=1 Tax=Streptomyces sp. NPDC020883 TaxID=3365099 RepID=UPI003799E224